MRRRRHLGHVLGGVLSPGWLLRKQGPGRQQDGRRESKHRGPPRVLRESISKPRAQVKQAQCSSWPLASLIVSKRGGLPFPWSGVDNRLGFGCPKHRQTFFG